MNQHSESEKNLKLKNDLQKMQNQSEYLKILSQKDEKESKIERKIIFQDVFLKVFFIH